MKEVRLIINGEYIPLFTVTSASAQYDNDPYDLNPRVSDRETIAWDWKSDTSTPIKFQIKFEVYSTGKLIPITVSTNMEKKKTLIKKRKKN